ncbi:hypothetical protein QO016_003047 [Methylobacterium persicinum]|uniref:Uncharacterized protein n=1 Tax=Methylobacterium persicinum TaxID=374426 RepID=A0ABU0HMI9_9HYPH|nr:hypothetical protein [Methylobacterium persicinum]GJE36846.1 hypothetical protein KHHGKMAE_0901 [Methylobacterium persicinum]
MPPRGSCATEKEGRARGTTVDLCGYALIVAPRAEGKGLVPRGSVLKGFAPQGGDGGEPRGSPGGFPSAQGSGG